MLEEMKEAIKKNVGHKDIQLNYRDGLMVLTGEVRTFYQKQMVQEIVRSVGKKHPEVTFAIKNDIFVEKNRE